MDIIKSKKRVFDHGEVFTPDWLVESMLDLVKGETERIDSRFLEPACGNGNFLIKIVQRKMATVEHKYGKTDFERKNYALLGLMSIYGIEILKDNIEECKANILKLFSSFLQLMPDLFFTVTGLKVEDFHLLTKLNVFNTEHMNQAIFAFRRYEDASLRYTGIESHTGLSNYGLFNPVVAIDQ